jgi:TetR/AcrR family transcriptional repressor of nem operon
MRNKARTRQLIIEKSAPIFNTKGYSSTSLGDIVKATGMTKGAIYGNFKNKEAVALAVLEYSVEVVFGKLRAEIKACLNAEDKLRAIVDYYEKYVVAPPIKGGCPILNTAVETDDLHPELRVKVLGMINTLHLSVIKIIQRGIREGQLRADIDVEEKAVFLIAALEGAIMLARVQGDAHSYRLISRQLHKIIDDMVPR